MGDVVWYESFVNSWVGDVVQYGSVWEQLCSRVGCFNVICLYVLLYFTFNLHCAIININHKLLISGSEI